MTERGSCFDGAQGELSDPVGPGGVPFEEAFYAPRARALGPMAVGRARHSDAARATDAATLAAYVAALVE